MKIAYMESSFRLSQVIAGLLAAVLLHSSPGVAVMKQPAPVKLSWKPLHLVNVTDPYPLIILDEETKKSFHYDEAKKNEAKGRAGPKPEEFVAIIGKALTNGQGIVGLVKEGINILKMFGIEEKEHAIIIDNRCPKCFLFIKCGTGLRSTDEFEVSPEDGLIVRFKSWFSGLVSYRCVYHDLDSKPDRWATIDAYGHGAPREKMNIFEVRPQSIVRMNEQGLVDGRQRQWSW